MVEWDSHQYLKFAEERKQPCIDLIDKLNECYYTVLDLGCGPGNSTRNLKNKFPKAEITGIDIDDNMLEKAKEDYPDIKFVKGSIPQSLEALNKKYDLIFSNACIHWIKNQEEMIEKVYDKLSSNGTFAIQIPLTEESKFYKILYALVDEKWDKIKDIDNFHSLSAEQYYNKLIKKFRNVTIWTTNYYHIIGSTDEIIEWYKGSGLRPYLNKLTKKERELFLNDLRSMVNKSFDVLEDEKVFLIMPRLFFIAKK